MRRVLVAGGTGLVGSALVDHLHSRGDQIAVLTRTPGRVPGFAEAIAIEHWRPDALDRALGGRRFDLLFNLAAYGVAPADADAAEAQAVNCDVARHFVAVARTTGTAALVHVGSVFEYAPWPHPRPIPEDAPLEMRLVYGAAKARGTHAVVEAARELGVPTVVARLFGVYGARERPHRLFPSLLRALSAGRRVSLSSGGQIRDIMHTADAAAGLAAVAGAVGSEPQIINVCSGIGVSVREVATVTAEVAGASQSLLGFGELPDRPQDASYLVGDTTRLHAVTAWRPRLSLRAGIEDAVREWRAMREG